MLSWQLAARVALMVATHSMATVHTGSSSIHVERIMEVVTVHQSGGEGVRSGKHAWIVVSCLLRSGRSATCLHWYVSQFSIVNPPLVAVTLNTQYQRRQRESTLNDL